MRKKPTELAEKYRMVKGLPEQYVTKPGQPEGVFMFPRLSVYLKVIVTPGDNEHPWEHVSVSVADRVPTWSEMCFVKDQFWDDDETVFQFHPAKKDYVNIHQFVLHLWKPLMVNIPLPPRVMV